MARLERTIEVAAPVEDVFSYVAEGLNTPSWHPSVKATRRTSSGPLGVGSKLEVEAVLAGRRFVWEQEVVEFVPGEYFRDMVRSGPFSRFEDWGRFEPTAAGTRWTFVVDYDLKGGLIGKLLDLALFRRRVREHHNQAMENAKQILEGRQTELKAQTGRTGGRQE